ncbi:MAG: Rieske 2Fe-2S domain-containing protein [Rhodospirillaceae bacterium]|nr:Rieske 2Fe-2S domain-containing protein [Rhodospirillaceae bacterium]
MVSTLKNVRPAARAAGTVDSFLESIGPGLDKGELPARIFGDAEVHATELDRVFARGWAFVGHETEIPKKGDYVLRPIGEDQFIVVRDEDGVIRVLLNNCVHRGVTLCRAEKGNTSHFRCPYHSWVYKTSGEWMGAPLRKRAYKEIDAKSWGLKAAPHVETVHGLIFASLNPDAVPLDDYLGGMRWYLDALFNLNESGLTVLGDPQRWKISANWKSAAENNIGDAYHVPSLHRSGEDIGIFPDIESGGAGGACRHLYFDEGHGMILSEGFLPEPMWHKTGFPKDIAATFQLDRLKPEQKDFLESYALTAGTIFPNLGIARVPASAYAGAPPVIFTVLRMWQPCGPDAFINWNWILGLKSAPEQYNKDAYAASLAMLGPAGVFEQDDSVVWEGLPAAGRSAFSRNRRMNINYQLGLEGMSEYEIDSKWKWPGHATTTALGEAPQRAFYRRWLRDMTTS